MNQKEKKRVIFAADKPTNSTQDSWAKLVNFSISPIIKYPYKGSLHLTFPSHSPLCLFIRNIKDGHKYYSIPIPAITSRDLRRREREEVGPVR